MKIYNTSGSRERLFEMMKNVNKIKLNENFNVDSPLINIFNKLINNTLNINQSKTHLEDDITYITISGVDDVGQKFEFVFELTAGNTGQDDVYSINNIMLKTFKYVNSMGEQTELNDDDLSDFNQENADKFYDIISKYVDIESEKVDDETVDTESDNEINDEIYENAIKTIDEIEDMGNISNTSIAKNNLPINVINKNFNNLSPEIKDKLIEASIRIVINRFKVRPNDIDISLYVQLIKSVALELINARLSSMNEDDNYPDKIGKEFKTSSKYPKPKKERPKKVKISEFDDAMSLEPETDDIEQLAQDREERGDQIKGGLGDDKSPLEFEPEQIKLGMKVEMEHTDDPLIALEIALDHLTEDPEYYTVKDNPEASAQANASTDAVGDDEPHKSGAYVQDGMAGQRDRNGHPIPAIDPQFMMSKSNDENPSGCWNDNMLNPDMGMGSPAELAKKMGWLKNGDDDTEDIMLGFKPKNVGDVDEDVFTGDPNKFNYDDEFDSDEEAEYNDYHNKSTPEKDTTDELRGFKPKNVGEPIDNKHYIVVFDGTSAYIKDPNDDIGDDTEIIGTYDDMNTAQSVADKHNNINENEYEEYEGKVGDKYVDDEGNEFVVSNKVKGGVSLKGRGGEKEVNTNDLKLTKKI